MIARYVWPMMFLYLAIGCSSEQQVADAEPDIDPVTEPADTGPNYRGVTLSKTAAIKFEKEIAKSQTPPETYVRLQIVEGGATGLLYDLKLDVYELNSDDVEFKSQGLRVVVDEESLKYVDGSEIDYVIDFKGARYQINNPNKISIIKKPPPPKEGSSFK